jgi:hypothetical protein
MKVKVHDFEQVYSELLHEPYCGMSDPHAVIEGSELIILVDKKGDHSIHTKMSRVVHYVIGATCCFYIPIKYLLTRATAIDDVELETFIPKEVSMGDYRILLNSIKLIGLNPDDYRRESR